MEYDYYTRRLHIHVVHSEDVAQVLDFQKRNRLYFEQYEEPKSRDFYTTAFQQRIMTAEACAFADNTFFRYYLSPSYDTSYIIGTISLKKYNRNSLSSMLLGYKIDHEMWRQGYAYEALSYLIPRIFISGLTDRLEALVNPDNLASTMLLLKLGFTKLPDDGIYRNTPSGRILHHLYFLDSGISVSDMHQ